MVPNVATVPFYPFLKPAITSPRSEFWPLGIVDGVRQRGLFHTCNVLILDMCQRDHQPRIHQFPHPTATVEIMTDAHSCLVTRDRMAHLAQAQYKS